MSINGTFTEATQTRRALALTFGLATAFALVLFLGLHAAEPAHAATQSFTVNWKKTRTFIIQFFSNLQITSLDRAL